MKLPEKIADAMYDWLSYSPGWARLDEYVPDYAEAIAQHEACAAWLRAFGFAAKDFDRAACNLRTREAADSLGITAQPHPNAARIAAAKAEAERCAPLVTDALEGAEILATAVGQLPADALFEVALQLAAKPEAEPLLDMLAELREGA